jgi:hypothetical protein
VSNPRFRLTSIALDEQQDVSEVTAAVSTPTLAVIREFLGDVPWTVLSESESAVTLPAGDMLRLFRACGKLSGLDPRYGHSHLIYDSLSHVVYGADG